MVSQRWVYGSFSFSKEYLSELQHFCLLFTLQNAARIVRALFEIALRKRWPAMTYRLLNLSKVIDKRLWGWVSPLRQFSVLPPSVLSKLEEKNLTIDKMKDMRKDEIGEKSAILIYLNYFLLLCKFEINLSHSFRTQTHWSWSHVSILTCYYGLSNKKGLFSLHGSQYGAVLMVAHVLPTPGMDMSIDVSTFTNVNIYIPTYRYILEITYTLCYHSFSYVKHHFERHIYFFQLEKNF